MHRPRVRSQKNTGRAKNAASRCPAYFEKAQADFPEVELDASAIIRDSLFAIEFGENLGMQTIVIEGDAMHRAHQKPGASKALQLPTCASSPCPAQ
jgi:hypothetical protein